MAKAACDMDRMAKAARFIEIEPQAARIAEDVEAILKGREVNK
jgi:hypothetical protein